MSRVGQQIGLTAENIWWTKWKGMGKETFIFREAKVKVGRGEEVLSPSEFMKMWMKFSKMAWVDGATQSVDLCVRGKVLERLLVFAIQDDLGWWGPSIMHRGSSVSEGPYHYHSPALHLVSYIMYTYLHILIEYAKKILSLYYTLFVIVLSPILLPGGK